MSAAKPRIGIVMSSTREGRLGETPAAWIRDIAARRGDIEVELIDLRDYPLPFFAESTHPAQTPSSHAVVKRWAAKLGTLDGFVFVVAEYNHGAPAVLKNAFDYVHHEYNRKPAGYVGYGGVGAARAVEQVRLTNVALQMAPMRTGVHIAGGDFIALAGGKSLDEMPHLAKSADAMLGELVWWTKALKVAREATARGGMAAAA